jgi:hypothetical protein
MLSLAAISYNWYATSYQGYLEHPCGPLEFCGPLLFMTYYQDFEVSLVFSVFFGSLTAFSLLMRNRPARNKVVLSIVFAFALSMVAFGYYYEIYSEWPRMGLFPSLA